MTEPSGIPLMCPGCDYSTQMHGDGPLMCPRCDDERLLPKIAALAVRRDRKEREDDLPEPIQSYDHYGRSRVANVRSPAFGEDETTLEEVKEQLKQEISDRHSIGFRGDHHD